MSLGPYESREQCHNVPVQATGYSHAAVMWQVIIRACDGYAYVFQRYRHLCGTMIQTRVAVGVIQLAHGVGA